MNELEKIFYERTGVEFNKFYTIHRIRMAWHLTKFTDKHTTQLEDEIEEIFIMILNGISTYKKPEEGGTKIITWAYKVGENYVKLKHKVKRKLTTVSLDNILNENGSFYDITPDKRENYSDIEEYESELKDKAEYVKYLIFNKLKDENRIPLVMREFENMTYKEIKEELNLNLSTVKNRIKKGREIVRELYKKKLNIYDSR